MRSALVSEPAALGTEERGYMEQRTVSRVEADPRAEVPPAGLSCPANAAGTNVTSVSLAVNPGALSFGFFVLKESLWDQREQVDCVGARWLLF